MGELLSQGFILAPMVPHLALLTKPLCKTLTHTPLFAHT
jgi:hypothetical protein